jgi:hypothetical protein
MQKNKSIYELSMHETTEIGYQSDTAFYTQCRTTRVPGGWVYAFPVYNMVPVFVPYIEEQGK